MGFNKPFGRGGGGGGGGGGRRSGSFDRQLLQINSRIQRAFTQIAQITDNAVAEFTSDVAKMSAALLKDATAKTRNSRSTGRLAASIKPSHHGSMLYSVDTTAVNQAGRGYGAAQEWGWVNKRSKRAKRNRNQARKWQKKRGKNFIVRATFGMVKRWQRGERWKD